MSLSNVSLSTLDGNTGAMGLARPVFYDKREPKKQKALDRVKPRARDLWCVDVVTVNTYSYITAVLCTDHI